MRKYRPWQFPALILVALVGCKEKDSRRTGIVDELHDSPLRYVGRTVEVSGKVDRVFEDRAFELDGDGVIWPKSLLVMTRYPVRFGPMRLQEAEQLVVHGTIHRISVDDPDLGQGIDPDLVDEHLDQPVLLADSVQLVETQARWSLAYQQGTVVSTMRLVSAIAPETFAGDSVDLADVPVRGKTDRGLWVGFGPHSQLFLVPVSETELAGIAVGDHVAIRGLVLELPTEAIAHPELEPAFTNGEKIYIEAGEVTKLMSPGT
jgi:hypothetical protein